MYLQIKNITETLSKVDVNPENPEAVKDFINTLISDVKSVTIDFANNEAIVLTGIGEEDLDV